MFLFKNNNENPVPNFNQTHYPFSDLKSYSNKYHNLQNQLFRENTDLLKKTNPIQRNLNLLSINEFLNTNLSSEAKILKVKGENVYPDIEAYPLIIKPYTEEEKSKREPKINVILKTGENSSYFSGIKHLQGKALNKAQNNPKLA